MIKRYRLMTLLVGMLALLAGAASWGATWPSSATGTPIEYTVTEPNPVVSPPKLIVYLEHLYCEKVGQEATASIVADFVANGFRVVRLDYAGHVNSTMPFLNADVLSIRAQIGTGAFPGSGGLNAGKNQCYILCEGYRLLRNVPYYLNDPSVYGTADSGAELHMDIAYPSQPSRAIAVVLEFSTSNSYLGNADDRMNNQNAFVGTNDTILEGASAAGIAWAMADQPKYCNWGSGGPANLYSGFETNTDTIKKVRSAVRVLRDTGETLGLSGKIAIHGMSRGASAGSMASGDLTSATIDLAGYSVGASSTVQAMLLGSGIFDFSHSGGTTTGDPAGTAVDIYNRFVNAWGPTASDLDNWQSQGPLYYMQTTAAPTFLSYNTDDGTFYPYQLQLLAAKLTSLGVEHHIATSTGGHKVTTNPATLKAIYNFFNLHLDNILPIPVTSAKPYTWMYY